PSQPSSLWLSSGSPLALLWLSSGALSPSSFPGWFTKADGAGGFCCPPLPRLIFCFSSSSCFLLLLRSLYLTFAITFGSPACTSLPLRLSLARVARVALVVGLPSRVAVVLQLDAVQPFNFILCQQKYPDNILTSALIVSLSSASYRSSRRTGGSPVAQVSIRMLFIQGPCLLHGFGLTDMARSVAYRVPYSTFIMAAIISLRDVHAASHQLTKRKNWAAREPGVVLVSASSSLSQSACCPHTSTAGCNAVKLLLAQPRV
ncbi:hypothetical protein TRV_07702, partial [Trichophyton verrucosum HKI 0517]